MRCRWASMFFGLASVLSGQIQQSINQNVYRRGTAAVDGIPAELRIKAIAAGTGRSLALASDGTVWEWGVGCWRYSCPTFFPLPSALQLSRPATRRVSGLSGVVAVASGYDEYLAVKEDGTVWTWGGHGSCGTTTEWATPVQVSGLDGVVAVTAGYQVGLALKGDGTVWAWGWVYHSGGTEPPAAWRTTPVQVSGIAGVGAITMGAGYNVGLKGDGTVWIWPAFGQSTPIQVGGLGGVTAIASGGAQSLALKGDGTVWTWSSYFNWLSLNETTPPDAVHGLVLHADADERDVRGGGDRGERLRLRSGLRLGGEG